MFEKGDIMETIRNVDVNRLHDFKNHPFKVEMNTELCELMRSIEKEGVLVPLLVRTNPYGDGYEVISGHRRKEAAIWAGETKVPVVIRELDDDQAVVAMVDSNLHRENLKPSEKAFAYKMKLDAMKHQGKHLDSGALAQVGPKFTDGSQLNEKGNNTSTINSNELLARQVGESVAQIKRYIRLVEEEEYLNYLSSDKMYVMLACGQYCYYVTRNTKHKIREYYGLDNKELKNLLHTSDDSVEFYLQYLLCKELHDLDLDKKGYANLFITDANCMYMRNYEKKALIKQNIYQLDKFNDDYNFYGFVSQIEEKGNKKASIINYIISEEDLIKNHSFKIINFFHDLLDKQKLLMYNQIGVRGVLLNCENTDIKDAEIIFEMIEECQLDWVVIGGGEHISIGQRRYEKFVNKINNKSNWTPISL